MCGKFKFHSDALMLKYREKSLNIFCFISLVHAVGSIKQTKADNAISFCIEESLKSKVGNGIDFENDILINKKYLKANQECIIV